MILTRRQKEILDYIRSYLETQGYSPTFEEMAQHFGFKSKGTVYKHIQALLARGAITQEKNRVRAIQPVQNMNTSYADIPVLGVAAAGNPIEALENRETMPIPSSWIGDGKHYVLKVSGTSMIDQHIVDNDLVLVNSDRTPKDGEMVVALIDNHEATIKQFFRRQDTIELRPANKELTSRFYNPEQVSFNGVVVAVIRRY